MASKKTAPQSATQAARTQQPRQAITLELVVAHAPHQGLVDNLVRTFGLDPVDYAAIRDTTEENVALSAKSLAGDLTEKAMQIHLQRITGAFVSSAYGASQFYGTKVSEARQLTMASENEHRDEDRDGVAGFDSKADRARLFAAQMGLQSFALLAAAEGAVSAYAHVTGEDWKPYEAPQTPRRLRPAPLGQVRDGRLRSLTSPGGDPTRSPPPLLPPLDVSNLRLRRTLRASRPPTAPPSHQRPSGVTDGCRPIEQGTPPCPRTAPAPHPSRMPNAQVGSSSPPAAPAASTSSSSMASTGSPAASPATASPSPGPAASARSTTPEPSPHPTAPSAASGGGRTKGQGPSRN